MEIKFKVLNLDEYRHIEQETSVDMNPISEKVVKHDLNNFPYPFPRNQFHYVRMFHALEHLQNPVKVLQEIHSICRDGATVHIKVPHFTRGFADMEHLHSFSLYSWFGVRYKPSLRDLYDVVSLKINDGSHTALGKVFGRIKAAIFNSRPLFFERNFGWLGIDEIDVKLQVKK